MSAALKEHQKLEWKVATVMHGMREAHPGAERLLAQVSVTEMNGKPGPFAIAADVFQGGLVVHSERLAEDTPAHKCPPWLQGLLVTMQRRKWASVDATMWDETRFKYWIVALNRMAVGSDGSLEARKLKWDPAVDGHCGMY